MKKTTKTISLLIALVMMVGLIYAFAITSSAAEGYSGTPAESVPTINSTNYMFYGLTESNWQEYDGYYAITTAEEFYKWSSADSDYGNAALFADIVINDCDVHSADPTELIPFNGLTGTFRDNFDGRGHSISGIFMHSDYSTGTSLTMFQYIAATASVKNLVIKNSLYDASESDSKRVSGLAFNNYGTVSNIVIESDVKLYSNDGSSGLINMPSDGCVIENCAFLGYLTVGSGTRYVGALFNTFDRGVLHGNVSNCYYIYGNSKMGDEILSAVGFNQESADFSTTIRLSSIEDTHVCVGIDHPATVASCYVEGNTEYSECIICDNFISGTKTITPIAHNFTDATCISSKTCVDCGATEGGVDSNNHVNQPTYEIVQGSEKHKIIYDCCGRTSSANHSFPSGAACDCGAEPKIKVTMNNASDAYYFTMDSALLPLRNATESDNAVLQLVDDIYVDSSVNIVLGVMTLDLNGKTLKNTSTTGSAIYTVNSEVKLTIIDSATGGSLIGPVYGLFVNDGTVIIEEAHISNFHKVQGANAGVKTSSGAAYINGGTIDSLGNAVYGSTDSSIVINGGTIIGEIYDIYSYDSVRICYDDEGNGPSFPGGLDTDDPIITLLDGNGFLYDSDGNLIMIDSTTKTVSGDVTVSLGTDLTGATVTVNGSFAYTGKEIKPTDVVVDFYCRTVASSNYTLSYANNLTVGTATVTITGVAPYTGSASAEFEIGKGQLRLAEAPVASYEFGDSFIDKPLTGGRVAIYGNNDADISGTWSWSGEDNWVKFTPDASYDGLFEELTSEIEAILVVTPATPVITLVTPSPSIMPGMTIQMGVEVKNPYDESLTDLPTLFKITYKVGVDGVETTMDGLKITIPGDVIVGETVFVYVESLAVDGKYTVTKSESIELFVGQVDYTAAIEEAVNNLNTLIDTKADASEVNEAIERLEKAIEDAELAAKAYADEKDGELNTALTEAIANAKNELTEAYTEAINTAKEELTGLINTKADASEVNEAIERLEKAIEDAEQLARNLDGTLRKDMNDIVGAAKEDVLNLSGKALEAAKEELKNLIDTKADASEVSEALDNLATAIQNAQAATEKFATDADSVLKKQLEAMITAAKHLAVQDANAALAEARAELEAVIDTKADASEVGEALDNLAIAIQTAQAAAEKFATDADAALKSLLETAIKDAKDAAIKAADEALNKAKAELNSAIEAGDGELGDRVADLNAALDNAEKALQLADEESRAELESAIADCSSALQAAVSDLNAKDDELTDSINKLNVALIVIGVIAGISLAANGALFVWMYLSRKGSAAKKENK